MNGARVLVVGAAAVVGLVGVGPVGVASAWNEVAGEPTVDSVLSAATKAVGGQGALDRIKTLHVVTTVGSGEQAVDLDSSWSQSGGRLLKATIPQMGQVVKGTDGTTAWQSMPMVGYTLMSEEETAQLTGQTGLHIRMLDFQKAAKGDMSKVEVTGKEKFAEHECIKVAFTKKKGGEGTMYFDAESGMPIGVYSDNGKIKSTSVFGDWKTIEGVKFFHSIKTKSEGGPRGGSSEMTVKTIEVNTLKDSDFALPEEVKKLAAEKKAEPAAGAIKLEDLGADQQKEAKNFTDAMAQMTTEQLKQQLPGMEMGVQYTPATDPKKKMMQYLVQEIKAEIKKRGG